MPNDLILLGSLQFPSFLPIKSTPKSPFRILSPSFPSILYPSSFFPLLPTPIFPLSILIHLPSPSLSLTYLKHCYSFTTTAQKGGGSKACKETSPSGTLPGPAGGVDGGRRSHRHLLFLLLTSLRTRHIRHGLCPRSRHQHLFPSPNHHHLSHHHSSSSSSSSPSSSPSSPPPSSSSTTSRYTRRERGETKEALQRGAAEAMGEVGGGDTRPKEGATSMARHFRHGGGGGGGIRRGGSSLQGFQSQAQLPRTSARSHRPRLPRDAGDPFFPTPRLHLRRPSAATLLFLLIVLVVIDAVSLPRPPPLRADST